ncbi:MAG: hypothetical protein JXX29_16905 [Deltaproteobacteria bacterium]|nr:hypothetical protein [Deltaproteobacteria bacterium]MBN2673366.1 hypothetical protein [Deltaproteobacteria bacterium]
MKPFQYISTILAACIFTLIAVHAEAGTNDSSANGRYSFQIETTYGSSLPTHYWNGYTYVEGREGQGYNIRVFNHSGKRIEAVVTVDGRDAISGELGNYLNNRGYVIEPYGSVLIKGFRTSWNNVAGFYFTDIEDSYSARMGSGQHVGVIGVAVFEEKERNRPRPKPIQIAPRKKRLGTGYGSRGHQHAEEAESSADAAAPSSSREGARRSRGTRTHAPSQSIGTGYGTREYSPATQTEFERKSRRPHARLAIYYDDKESLIERGIIPRPKPPVKKRRTPNPFPENNDPGFAPPPPPRHYWE